MGALYQVASGQVAADGTVTLTFPAPGLGLTWTGTINIPNATGSESWTAKVAGQTWGTFLGLAAFGPIQAAGQSQISVAGSGLTAGTTYRALLIGEEAGGVVRAASPLPQPLTLSQIASTVTAAVSGAVTANMPQASMVGSPHTWASPATVTFTWPAGGPYSSVTLTVYNGVTFSQVTVTGVTTGRVYLSEVIDRGEWKLPVSSLVEPGGITVNASTTYGYGGAWSFQAALVATVSPDIVAPVWGPGVGGPTNFADGLVQANTTASVTLLGGGRSTTARVWSAWLSMQVQGGAAIVSNRAYIGYPGGNILTCCLGAAAATNAQNSVSLTYPGGLVVPIGNVVAPLTLSVDTSTVAYIAAGGVAYSLDSA